MYRLARFEHCKCDRGDTWWIGLCSSLSKEGNESESLFIQPNSGIFERAIKGGGHVLDFEDDSNPMRYDGGHALAKALGGRKNLPFRVSNLLYSFGY